ncbi:hypothetical protein HUJ05_010440 [Dendroctonus ponderosae]|nr:hypothetical protein HUJ05_010440 [Dendroctonus ponderosae]
MELDKPLYTMRHKASPWGWQTAQLTATDPLDTTKPLCNMDLFYIHPANLFRKSLNWSFFGPVWPAARQECRGSGSDKKYGRAKGNFSCLHGE